MWGWPEIVFLILTKIFSKSAKSLQEDWNMCMKLFTNRFSILESHRYRRHRLHHSYTHHRYHICYRSRIKVCLKSDWAASNANCRSATSAHKQAEHLRTALEAHRGKLPHSFSISTTFLLFCEWYIIRHPSEFCYFRALCLLSCAAAWCIALVFCVYVRARAPAWKKRKCKCPWW